MQLERLVSLFKTNNFDVALNQDSDTGYFSLIVSDLALEHLRFEVRSPDYNSQIEIKLDFHKEGLFLDPNMESVYYHILRMMNTLLNEHMYLLCEEGLTDKVNRLKPFRLKIERLMQIQAMNVAYDAVIQGYNIEDETWIRDVMGKNVIQAHKGELFIFIDQEPNANWAHPCIYAVINLDSNKLRFKEAEWPPSEKNIFTMK